MQWLQFDEVINTDRFSLEIRNEEKRLVIYQLNMTMSSKLNKKNRIQKEKQAEKIKNWREMKRDQEKINYSDTVGQDSNDMWF